MSIQGINVPFTLGNSQIISQNNSITTIQSGSDVSLSFYIAVPFTGLAIGESFVPKSWNFTGYSLGSSVTGSGIVPMSGRFYQRGPDGAQAFISGFIYGTGIFAQTSGGVSLPITGQNRVGFDITGMVSGLKNLTVAMFGF